MKDMTLWGWWYGMLVTLPLFVAGLALYRLREPTAALVVAASAAILGLWMVAIFNPGPGHLLWVGSIGTLAAAAAWARREW